MGGVKGSSDMSMILVINLGDYFTGEFILWKFIELYTYAFYSLIKILSREGETLKREAKIEKAMEAQTEIRAGLGLLWALLFLLWFLSKA